MAGITCYNIDGTPLSHLTQWDKNIVLVLKGAETSPEPEIHFSNKRSQTAIIVDPEISGDSISVEVPNVLLEDGYPLTVRIYYTYDDGSSRTRYTKFINVQPKARPDDYVGTDPDGDGGGEVDLSDYAKKEWVQDRYQPKGDYLTEIPDGYATIEQIPTHPSDIGAQPVGDYALKAEIPSVPVQSVNGKTGAVQLSASDVKARSDSWLPTASQVGADPSGTASSAISSHNTNVDAHNDLRLELKSISDRINAFFDSDDQTLDELSEIVAYIKSNKTLIDSITTNKVSVADIVNNLTTNAAGKPLSAAQGVALKALVDAITVPTKLSQLTNDSSFVTSGSVQTVVNSALTEAKNSGQFDGDPGQRGLGLLAITTAPSSYTTAVNGITPAYRISLSTVKTQASVSEVFAGDTLRYSYYHYPVVYVDSSYVYCRARVSIRGATGADPVKGIDYYTDADKTEMVGLVKASLPTVTITGIDADGVSHTWTLYGAAN